MTNHHRIIATIWVICAALAGVLILITLLALSVRNDVKMLDSLEGQLQERQEQEMRERDQRIAEKLRNEPAEPAERNISTVGGTPVPDGLRCAEDEVIGFSADAPRYEDADGREGYGLACVHPDEY